MDNIYVKNARYVYTDKRITMQGDFRISNGEISTVKDVIPSEARIIDACGRLLCPALIDMHVHLREPGFESKETIASGTAAARAGGFSHILSMPNTNPVTDTPEVVNFIRYKADGAASCSVLPIAAITKGQAGAELTDFAALKEAGAVAFSDDGRPVEDASVLRRALTKAKEVGSFIISHCEDLPLAKNTAMNEGEISRKLGLRGNPNSSESIAVAREVLIAGEVGAHIHIAHISTRESVEIIRHAKKFGIPVTCETCPHYFTLTDEAVELYGVNAKMNPPLRSKRDLDAIIEGLLDGTIDSITTDHAPHTDADKFLAENDMNKAANGIMGLETSFALGYTNLVRTSLLSIYDLLNLMHYSPAKILGLANSDRHYMLAEDEDEWTVDKSVFKSKSTNTPFDGFKLCGKCEVING